MKVPDWFCLVFKNKEAKHLHWPLFEWMFDLGPSFTESLLSVGLKDSTVLLVTLKYLLQVIPTMTIVFRMIDSIMIKLVNVPARRNHG